MADINIKETIQDKNSFFNIKRFKLGNLSEECWMKTIDIPNTSKKLWSESMDLKNSKIIFEKSKTIKDFESINSLINEGDDKKINSFFDKKAWLNDYFSIFHATLKFNPYNHVKKISDAEGFWHYYYSFSKDALFIPNIIKDKTPYDDGKPQNKEEIISFKEYIRFVDELYEFFQQMNNKPIFVPISLRFDINETKSLIEHYLSKEYFYMWIDFEAKPADPSNGAIYARIRQINSVLRGSNQFDKCLLLVTNIKREIISNSKDKKSPASDVLGSLCGANIVGVNREPGKYFSDAMKEKQKEMVKHKARLFDPQSYYYLMSDTNNDNKVVNVTENSNRLAKEFSNQKQEFLKDFDISNYLKKKEMITSYHKGKILKSFFIKKNDQKKLF